MAVLINSIIACRIMGYGVAIGVARPILYVRFLLMTCYVTFAVAVVASLFASSYARVASNMAAVVVFF